MENPWKNRLKIAKNQKEKTLDRGAMSVVRWPSEDLYRIRWFSCLQDYLITTTVDITPMPLVWSFFTDSRFRCGSEIFYLENKSPDHPPSSCWYTLPTR
jgi:hypothetical protein